MEGILNILKPPGMTSHDVVYFVRRIYGLKRVGHAGTLDPAAAGVLPVFLGQATRLVEYLSEADKSYCVELTLGWQTDTGDNTGRVTGKIADFEMPAKSRLQEVLNSFTGDILQAPPMYSAVKVDGKKLYELARVGIEVERKLRPVSIHVIKLLTVSANKILFNVTCSKGTYMRTLCTDIGEKLGLPAVMSFLVRTRVGQFLLDNASTLEEIQAMPGGLLYNKAVAVEHLPRIILSDLEEKRFKNGQTLQVSTGFNNLLRVYNQKQEFIGVARQQKETLTALKVFLTI